jgi:hypothetical protein
MTGSRLAQCGREFGTLTGKPANKQAALPISMPDIVLPGTRREATELLRLGAKKTWLKRSFGIANTPAMCKQIGGSRNGRLSS